MAHLVGRGTVYSFSVVRKAEHPFFRARVPYAVAWIDLDEGFRMLSNVIGVDVRQTSRGAAREGRVGESRRASVAAVPARLKGLAQDVPYHILSS